MFMRHLFLALASALLLAGCVTYDSYGRGDGYYRAPGTVYYRSNRGYPYGWYGDYYRYGVPYGYYGPRYRYGYDPYYYGGYYRYPRYSYPHHHHHSRPPASRPPSTRPPSGKPPWRELDKLRPPTQGRQIAPPSTSRPATSAPRPSARPATSAPRPRPSARPATPPRSIESPRKGRNYYKRGGLDAPQTRD